MSQSRNRILARLRDAQKKRSPEMVEMPDFASPVYHDLKMPLSEQFSDSLEILGGKVILCKNLNDAAMQLRSLSASKGWKSLYCTDPLISGSISKDIPLSDNEDDFLDLQAGITPCEALIAHLGAILVSSAGKSGRRLHAFPETHIVFAHTNQLFGYLEEGLQYIHSKYDGNLPSLISAITGPSRTADIEKTLVMGMHGPKELFVLLCEEPF